jgi:hypothetical protein
MTFRFMSVDKVMGQCRCQFGRFELDASELGNSRLETPLFSYENLQD